MESYDDQYVSYDPLPYGLLAAEVTKEPAHVTNPHDPALWTHRLRRPQIQVHLLRDPQVLHYHSSLPYAYDAHSQRLIVANSLLSVDDRVAVRSSSAYVLVDVVTGSLVT